MCSSYKQPHAHLREHVLQRVAALVKEGFTLAESHERRRDAAVGVGDGRRLVAHHVRHGQPHRRTAGGERGGAGGDFVHPRTSPLLGRARVRVEVEVGAGAAVGSHHLEVVERGGKGR